MTPRNRIARYFTTPTQATGWAGCQAKAPSPPPATQATAEPPIASIPSDPRQLIDHLRGLLAEADAVVTAAEEAFRANSHARNARTLTDATRFSKQLRQQIAEMAVEMLHISRERCQGD